MKAALICFTARGEVTMQAAAKVLQKKGWETASYVKRKDASCQAGKKSEEEIYEKKFDTGKDAVAVANREHSAEKSLQKTEENIFWKTTEIIKPLSKNRDKQETAEIIKSLFKSQDKENKDIMLCTESLRQWCQNMFSTCELLIFVGATGIAVRGIAPFVQDKRTDPAVLAIDEAAAYVIPLLSGHIGGANELAKWLAEDLQATAVITTATDINHKIAIDVFARKNNLWISDMKLAKEVSADILQGKKILVSADEEKTAELAGLNWPPELVFHKEPEYQYQNADIETKRDVYAIQETSEYIKETSDSKNTLPLESLRYTSEIMLDEKFDRPSIITREKDLDTCGKKQNMGSDAYKLSDIHVHIGLRKRKNSGQQRILYLIPRVAVLGIGCKKGTPQDVIQKQITEVLTAHGILEEAVDMAATIDLKAKEPGLLSLTEAKGWKFQTFSAEELRAVPGTYQASAFVQSVTGVDNVCERSAKLASNYGKIIIEKHGACGVTVACAEKDWSVNL